LDIGEIFFYRDTKVEIIEIDIEFDLILIRNLSSEISNYVSSKLLNKSPHEEKYISICLLEGEKRWY